MTEPETPEDQAQLERIRIFFGHAKGNLMSLLLGGAIIDAVLHSGGTSLLAILCWDVVLVLAVIAAWMLESHVLRTGVSRDNAQGFYKLRVRMGALISFVYGVSVFLLPTQDTHAEHTFLFMIMSTVVTTVALGYAVMPSYYLTINVAAMAPSIVLFLFLYATARDSYYLLMVFVSLVWQFVILRKAHMVSRTVINGIGINLRLQQEIEEHKRTREAISYMAMHDDLTGLANRRYFEQVFERTLNQAERSQSCFGLLSIDLNDFKPVNDTHGHATGDHLLKIVAERLRKATRAGDFCARIGGDEFAVLCTPIKDPTDLDTITRNLKQALSSPFAPDDIAVPTSASIGWAAYPADGDNLTRLSACADLRMYADKQEQKAASRA